MAELRKRNNNDVGFIDPNVVFKHPEPRLNGKIILAVCQHNFALHCRCFRSLSLIACNSLRASLICMRSVGTSSEH